MPDVGVFIKNLALLPVNFTLTWLPQCLVYLSRTSQYHDSVMVLVDWDILKWGRLLPESEKKLSSLSIFHSFLSSISLPLFFWHACTGVSLLVSIRNTLLTIIGRSWSGGKSSKVLTGWSHRACLGKGPGTSRCSSVIMSHCTAVYKIWCLWVDAHKTFG